MDLKVGILIGTSLLLLIPEPSTSIRACTSFQDLADPCGCTISKDNFDPLCGSDGNTYLNACFLHCRETIDKVSIRVDYKGICSKDGRCTCNADYNPVCGNNGFTYSNECVLKCHARKNSSLRLKHNGECNERSRYYQTSSLGLSVSLRSRVRTCVCNPSSGPLCATNGISYPNYCVMRCKAQALNDKSIKFSYWGLCSSQEIGPYKPDELVVEGGHKNKNQDQWYNQEYVEEPPIIQMEPRLSANKPICDCPLNSVSYFTRCGSDNNGRRQYSSTGCFCMPKNQNLQYEDPCSKKQSRPEEDDERLNMVVSKTCVCAALHKPVCGSDHQTYANMCVLHCRAKKSPNIKFLQWGTCEDVRLVSRLPDPDDLNGETIVRTSHLRSDHYRDHNFF